MDEAVTTRSVDSNVRRHSNSYSTSCIRKIVCFTQRQLLH